MTEKDAVAAAFDRLRGRCCGLIESWGVDERQERAMVQTFKSLTYDAEKEVKQLLEEGP